MTLSFRILNFLLVFITIAASMFALGYLQNHLLLEPCPLCIFQRIGLWIMGVFALLSATINPKSTKMRLLLWIPSTLGTLWGMGVATRHVWLQHLPAEQVPECGPGLNYWVDTLPIMQVFQEALKGSGECATIDWTLFGLSLPALTLILFVVIFIIQLMLLAKIIKKH